MQAQSYTSEILAGMQRVEESWKRVRDCVQEAAIRAGRDPSEVRLMAVTKTVEPVYINHAISLGATLISRIRCRSTCRKNRRSRARTRRI